MSKNQQRSQQSKIQTLIALIVKKQSYKETKEYQQQIFRREQNAHRVSILAIKQILNTNYNIQAKLYAIRYLKDCFQKGNPKFIRSTQTDILPLLKEIVMQENDPKAIERYAMSNYAKSSELQKYKSILQSLFRITKECIWQWGRYIRDSQFERTVEEFKDMGIKIDRQLRYFRDENYEKFRQNQAKFGGKQQIRNEQREINQIYDPLRNKKPHSSKDIFKDRLQEILQDAQSLNVEQIQKQDQRFNEAINEYCQKSTHFNDTYLQQSIQRMEAIKKDLIDRSKKDLIDKNKERIKNSNNENNNNYCGTPKFKEFQNSKNKIVKQRKSLIMEEQIGNVIQQSIFRKKDERYQQEQQTFKNINNNENRNHKQQRITKEKQGLKKQNQKSKKELKILQRVKKVDQNDMNQQYGSEISMRNINKKQDSRVYFDDCSLQQQDSRVHFDNSSVEQQYSEQSENSQRYAILKQKAKGSLVQQQIRSSFRKEQHLSNNQGYRCKVIVQLLNMQSSLLQEIRIINFVAQFYLFILYA